MSRPAKMPDLATRLRIAQLHREHGISYKLLGERFGMSGATAKKICDEARPAKNT
jgi:hypothetical protein